MATAYKCDRCNVLFENRRSGRLYNIFYGLSSKFPEDLCPDCSEKLDKWMKNKADFVPKEENKDDVQQNV